MEEQIDDPEMLEGDLDSIYIVKDKLRNKNLQGISTQMKFCKMRHKRSKRYYFYQTSKNYENKKFLAETIFEGFMLNLFEKNFLFYKKNIYGSKNENVHSPQKNVE